MTTRRRALQIGVLLAVGLSGAAVWGLNTTVSTRQGVNFAVSRHSVPLYVKVLDFLHRDAHYRLLARQITAGVSSDQARVLAVFDWTRRHIRPTPKGWPIVDDHILDIIIRGHGVEDQMADVFCTLTTYAGAPAFWKPLRDAPEGAGLVLSFAKTEGAWRVFDVAHGVAFRDPDGQLVAVETLLATPLLSDAAADPVPADLSYAAYFERLQPFTVPDPLRAEQQMPWPRLAFELRRILRLASDVEGEGR